MNINILVIISCICMLFIIGRIFIIPIRKILKHWGIENKFEKVYSMLDMNLKKSYVLENSKTFFGFDQPEIVVFEDSPNTINLANSLGCETVYIDNGDNNLKCNYDFKIDVGSDYAKESTRI